MKFNLYVELASRLEDEKVLDLLRFPADSIVGSGARWSCKWWAHGSPHKTITKNREEVLSGIAVSGFNDLELVCRTDSGPEGQTRPFVSGAWVQTELSPGNILWAPVREAELDRPQDDRNRRSFAAHTNLEAFARPYPSVVEYLFEIEASNDADDEIELQRISVDLIRSGIPLALAGSDIFGYGCIEGRCRRQRMTHNLMGRGGSIDELGEKFENIYPILFGPRASCEGVAHALGCEQIWPLFPNNSDQTYIVSIPAEKAIGAGPRPPNALALSARDPAVRKWIV